MTAISEILETVLYVDDLDDARAFYEGALGLEVAAAKPGVFVFFRLERAMLLVFDPRAARDQSSPPGHGAIGPGHLCFRVPEQALDEWRTRLADAGAPITDEIVWPNGARSVYFEDPAGNCLELAPARLWEFDDAMGDR